MAMNPLARRLVPRTFLSSFALVVAVAHQASAQAGAIVVPDVTTRLGTVQSATIDDDDIAVDGGTGFVSPVLASLTAAIPVGAEIAAIDSDPSGKWWIVLDTTAQLPGLSVNAPATPLKVLRFRPATADFEFVLDLVGQIAGFPPEARIDALVVRTSGDLFLSFDVTVAIPGRFTCDDEDLVAYNFGSGSWSLVFDGSARGIAEGLDLDAASAPAVLSTNPLLISFDGGGSAGSVAFDDEDVLAYDVLASTYTMHFDGSSSDPDDWPAADLVAVPEPGALIQGCVGAAALAGLVRSRGFSTRRHTRTTDRPI